MNRYVYMYMQTNLALHNYTYIYIYINIYIHIHIYIYKSKSTIWIIDTSICVDTHIMSAIWVPFRLNPPRLWIQTLAMWTSGRSISIPIPSSQHTFRCDPIPGHNLFVGRAHFGRLQEQPGVKKHCHLDHFTNTRSQVTIVQSSSTLTTSTKYPTHPSPYALTLC